MPTARRIRPSGDARSASGSRAARRARNRALAELAAGQHGVVAARQLRNLGFSKREITNRLREHHLHELHLGVYAVGHPSLSQNGRWMAAVLGGGPEALLSHCDGLALWDVAAFNQDDVEITIPGLGSRRRPGIRVHRTRRLDPEDRDVVRGIPVTSLARTFADVCGSIAPRHLRDAYLEAGRRDLLDLDDLLRVIDAYRGKRGIGRLRRLVAEDTRALRRTRSPLEAAFWDFCRAEGLPEPLVNHRVHGFELDAYWPQARLAVELDSWEFHRGRGAFERDRAKIVALSRFGIRVLPVTDHQLKGDRAALAASLRAAIGAQPPS